MRESATCSLCGHGYTYPAGLDEKAGMHCTACGVLIHVKTGLPFGEAPSSPSGQKPENAVKTPASLPPSRKSSRLLPDGTRMGAAPGKETTPGSLPLAPAPPSPPYPGWHGAWR
ncbi:MAG: hypothetical protein V8Q21_00340 [Akkermansia muciniphila]